MAELSSLGLHNSLNICKFEFANLSEQNEKMVRLKVEARFGVRQRKEKMCFFGSLNI